MAATPPSRNAQQLPRTIPKERGGFYLSSHDANDVAMPEPPAVAEPRPRISPSSSGFSVKRLPQPSVQQLRAACTHYREKAKVAPQRSVRYLHDLAAEVESQLDQVDVHSRNCRRRSQQLETMMSEWEALFGPHARAVRTTEAEKKARDEQIMELV